MCGYVYIYIYINTGTSYSLSSTYLVPFAKVLHFCICYIFAVASDMKLKAEYLLVCFGKKCKRKFLCGISTDPVTKGPRTETT